MIAQIDIEYLKQSPMAAYRRIVSRTFFEGRPITTKGRWLNSLVFTLFEIYKRLPRHPIITKPIFIVGTGRSGTTILGTLLSLHPDVGYLNEPKALWYAIYDGEDVIGHYSQGPARYRLFDSDANEGVITRAYSLYGAYLQAVRASRVIEKNPEMVFRISFLKAIFPDAKFIFLVRNGWDTVKSIALWSEREGVKKGNDVYDWWGVNNRKWKFLLDELVANDDELLPHIDSIRGFESHLDRAVIEWIVTMKEGIHYLEKEPSTMLLQRYEDLVSNPRQSLMKMLEFCELSISEPLLSYAERRLRAAPHYANVEIKPYLLDVFTSISHKLGY